MKSFLLSFLIPVGVFAAIPPQNSDGGITVTGSCNRSVKPDRASIVLTVEETGKTVKQASTKATKRYKKLRGRVAQLKLAKAQIATTEYSVEPIREWDEKTKKYIDKGFKARAGLKVSSQDMKKLERTIGIATKLGVQDVGRLQIYVSPAKIRKEREKCLRMAAKNARNKALKLASSLKVNLGKLKNLVEVEGTQAVTVPRRAKMDLAGSASAPIDVGVQDVKVQVRASFGVL